MRATVETAASSDGSDSNRTDPRQAETTERGTHKARLFVQTGLHKLLQGFAVVPFQCRRVVFGDEE